MTTEEVFETHPSVDVLYLEEASKQVYFTRKTVTCVAVQRDNKTTKESLKKQAKCKI